MFSPNIGEPKGLLSATAAGWMSLFIPKDLSLGYSKQQVAARGERGYIPEFRPKNLDFRDVPC